MNDILSNQYGLTFNPFRADIPVEALSVDQRIDTFLFGLNQQLRDGGFAAVTGEPGTGKSTALRVVASRLAELGDVKVGILSRPQGNNADFYREIGDLFGVSLSPHNRWVGSKALRQQWLAHIDKNRLRPVLIIDEAQEMRTPVFTELRILSSMNLDARALLTIVLAGDDRLTARLGSPDLLPILSRIRVHLQLGHVDPERLYSVLEHALAQAGRADLVTDEVKRALSTHAHGNMRSMMVMADQLLCHAMQHDNKRIDEQCFFDVFGQSIEPEQQKQSRQAGGGRRR